MQQQITTNNKQQTTNNKQQTTNNKQQTTTGWPARSLLALLASYNIRQVVLLCIRGVDADVSRVFPIKVRI
jgi:hypothetical protein